MTTLAQWIEDNGLPHNLTECRVDPSELDSAWLHWGDLNRVGNYDGPIEDDGLDRHGRVAVYTLDWTSWGDYVGDTYTRSNCRSILRDYPDDVIEVRGWYSSECVAIRADVELPDDLLDSLDGMSDYPLWDESDHSDLEMDLEYENWESYGRDDFRREVEREWREIHETDMDLDDDILPDADLDARMELERCEVGSVYAIFEDAVSCYWDGIVDLAKDYAGELPGPDGEHTDAHNYKALMAAVSATTDPLF